MKNVLSFVFLLFCTGLVVIAIVLMTILLSVACHADDSLVLDAGMGVFHSADKGLSETKMLKGGLEMPVWEAFRQRVNTGFWLDTTESGPTGFLGYQIGYEVSSSDLEASAWTGPGFISHTDSLLGGPFQFNDTLFLGIHDQHHQVIGLSYNHWSSAGLEMPNIGRDIIGLEIKIPF